MTRLVVVGRGPQLRNLIALAKGLCISDRIDFEGEVSGEVAMAAQYQTASVLVLPSLSESFGLVIAEALSLEVPVIATSTIGARSIIRQRETGLIVESRSPVSIANAILWVLSNPEQARAMARKGKDTVENLRPEKIALWYERVLHSMTRTDSIVAVHISGAPHSN